MQSLTSVTPPVVSAAGEVISRHHSNIVATLLFAMAATGGPVAAVLFGFAGAEPAAVMTGILAVAVCRFTWDSMVSGPNQAEIEDATAVLEAWKSRRKVWAAELILESIDELEGADPRLVKAWAEGQTVTQAVQLPRESA